MEEYKSIMPQQKTPTKGGVPRMRKLVMSISEDLHKALKFRAVELDTTIREIVTKAIEHELEKGGKQKG
jgi:hypothetical protein